jgi:hypothetical protein
MYLQLRLHLRNRLSLFLISRHRVVAQILFLRRSKRKATKSEDSDMFVSMYFCHVLVCLILFSEIIAESIRPQKKKKTTSAPPPGSDAYKVLPAVSVS